MTVRILGISAYYHDSAITLLQDGKIEYAAQEERFSRIKYDKSFPKLAIKNLLAFKNLKMQDIDYFVFFEKPFLKFERLLETYINFAPRGFKQFLFSMPIWLKDKLFMKRKILNELKKFNNKINSDFLFFSDHHLSHAGSAFFASPFSDSLILTADGVGEWTTTCLSIGKNNKIDKKKEIKFPHSLGLLYSAFTFYLGFKVNSGEYKVMGLAPYGKPIYTKLIKDYLIDIKTDGSFRINQKYFDYATGFKMTSKYFHQLFNCKPRKSESKIETMHMNIASSIQKVTEEVILKILKTAKNEYKNENLCLAGGVALNCVINGLIVKEKIFKKIWIQPASGDAGGSLGAALSFWYMHLKKKRFVNKKDMMKGSYLGNSYKRTEIELFIKKNKLKYTKFSYKNLFIKLANEVARGKVIGLFQGRMEFGPRSLGSRSIIADPRNKNMQKKLNLKIKFRESFRPFAPAVLFQKQSEWFEMSEKSPYMLLVSDVKADKLVKINQYRYKNKLENINLVRSKIPSVTHIDNSARIQSVDGSNKFINSLLEEFYKKTKVPILINTSFNIRGEPIVCRLEDALKCFNGTDIDILVIENYIIEKKFNKQNNKTYINEFLLD